ncbi:unnamed protein product, partial [marine sediment metagenome]
PAPAAHESTHVSGGADDIDSALAIAAIPRVLNAQDLQFNAGLADHDLSGIFVASNLGTVGENVALGDVLYMKSDGKWWLADADGTATMPGMGLAATGINAESAGSILLKGLFRDDSWGWTLGATDGFLYVHTTGGNPTQTQPSGSGDQVQIVGYVLTTKIIQFDPCPVIVEIA